jgi:hypothetical protein
MLKSSGRRLLVVALGSGLVLSGGGATAADPVRITEPVHVTSGDPDPGRTFTTPSVAIDPANPLVAVATLSEARTRRCGLARTSDGGQTWTRLDSSPSPSSHPFCFTANFAVAQGQVAFGRNSTLYYALPGWDVQDGSGTRGNVSLVVARSSDLGDSWQTTIVRDNRGKEGDEVENAARPITSLVVDRERGNDDTVYVTWTRNFPNRTAPNLEPVRAFMAVSTDGGRSFSEPVDLVADAFESEAVRNEALKTTTTTTPTGPTTTTTVPAPGSRVAQPNQAANFGGRDATLTLDDDGTVYVAWRAQSSNITPAVHNALFLTKTTDNGRTLTVSQITDWTPRARQPVLRWSKKGGGQGTLHLVYEGTNRPAINNDSDIFYRRSIDGGRTWTDPKVLNDDDPALLYAQGIPNMSIAPNGRIDVVWWDLRNDPGLNFANDVYHASSSDNGATWSANNRITDQVVDRRVGVFGNNFDVSAPPALATTNAHVLVAWDDTRNSAPGELGAGTQDVYTANVQYAAVAGGTSNAAKIVLAAVVGLLVVGLVLLSVALATRRTGTRPRPARAGQDQAPAKVG